MSEQHDFADLWAIHSEKDGMPIMCGWAHSESEARQKMAELQKTSSGADVEYWIMRMTLAEADSFKTNGAIPQDA